MCCHRARRSIVRDDDVAETQALASGEGESMIHDLVTTGTEDIVFTTVEFIDSANDALPLSAGRRA